MYLGDKQLHESGTVIGGSIAAAALALDPVFKLAGFEGLGEALGATAVAVANLTALGAGLYAIVRGRKAIGDNGLLADGPPGGEITTDLLRVDEAE